jgi:hypothetical protein
MKVAAATKQGGRKKPPRANKKSVAAQVGQQFLRDALGTTPRQHAVGHTKRNELGGKLRPIYGVDYTHYNIAGLVANAAETAILTKYTDVGADVRTHALNTAERVTLAGAGAAILSFDFSDFNSMHTTDALKSIYDAKAAWFKLHFADDPALKTYVDACAWLAKAEDNTTIERPDTNAILRTRRRPVIG